MSEDELLRLRKRCADVCRKREGWHKTLHEEIRNDLPAVAAFYLRLAPLTNLLNGQLQKQLIACSQPPPRLDISRMPIIVLACDLIVQTLYPLICDEIDRRLMNKESTR